MKKFIKLFYIFILVIGFIINIDIVKAKDVTSGFKVVDAHIYLDDEMKNENSANNRKREGASSRFKVKIDWKYDGEVISAGDKVSIPFFNEILTENTVSIAGDSSLADFYDNNGLKMGQWQYNGSDKNKKLIVNFSDNAVGKNNVEGTFVTSRNMFDKYSSLIDRNLKYNIGNKEVTLFIKAYPYNENTSDAEFYTGASSSNVLFNFNGKSNQKTLKELFRYNEYTELTDDAICDSVYYEVITPVIADTHEIRFYINYGAITDYTNHLYTGHNNFNITNLMTKVDQNTSETYEQFKARLNPLEYGFFKQGDQTIIVANMGNQPSTVLPTYKELLGNEVGNYNYNINPYTYSSESIEIFNRAVGSNNIIGGKVANFYIGYDARLNNPVLIDTPATATGTWTCDARDGVTYTVQKQRTSIAQPTSGFSVSSGVAALILRDKNDLSRFLEGVKFKLEKKNGNNWEVINDDLTTDSQGLIRVNNLVDGEYRFVQKTYLDHYINNSFKNYKDASLTTPLTTFNVDGTINYATNERENVVIAFKNGGRGFDNETLNLKYNDPVLVPEFATPTADGWTFVGWDKNVSLVAIENQTYIAKWEKKVKIIEHYYEEGTTEKVRSDKSTTVNVGSNYSVTRSDAGIDNKYIYFKTTGTTSGVVPDNNVEIIYYYKLKPSVIKVKHLEDGTNTPLADEQTINKKYDDTYTTSRASSITQNYDLLKTTGDPVSGTINKDNYEVIYWYKKTNSKITNNITKTTQTDEITSKDDVVNYTITSNIIVKDYIGNGTVTITDTLPYEIDIDKSNISGATYNKDNKTLTWTETWNGIDSFNNKGNKTITKNISIVYSNLDSTQRIMTNTTSSNIRLDNNNSTNTNSVDNNIAIKGKVIIKYLDEDLNELTDTIEVEDLVGETTSSEVLDFEGYDLVEKPENEIHTIGDEITEIVYKYKRKVLNIEVITGNGGKATGGGSVKYGEDSNDIVITSDEGYCIDKIIVDDKEINVVNCKNQTVDKFTNVKENHKVKVTFKKNVINSNPVTSSLIKIAFLIILIGVSAVLVINNKKLIKAN